MPKTSPRKRRGKRPSISAAAQRNDITHGQEELRLSDAERSVCARFHHAIELVGRRWTGAILHILFQGPARFRVMSAAIPEMTDRMLSERLRELEEEGLVARTVVPSMPVRIEYALSDMGRDLAPSLVEIAAWAHRWLPPPVNELEHEHASRGDADFPARTRLRRRAKRAGRGTATREREVRSRVAANPRAPPR